MGALIFGPISLPPVKHGTASSNSVERGNRRHSANHLSPKPIGFKENGAVLCCSHLQRMDAIGLQHESLLKFNNEINKLTLVSMLKECSSPDSLDQGMWIHSHIIENELESDPYVGCTLISMYARCECVLDALRAFTILLLKPVEAWNAIIGGLADCGFGDEGIKRFEQMQLEGVKPNRVTFICVLKACSVACDLQQGRRIHAFLIESGYEFGIHVNNTLINMYVKCNRLQDAQNVFCRSIKYDVVAYNTLMAGYTEQGYLQGVIRLFKEMQDVGIVVDQASFVCVLKACCTIDSLQYGREIHANIIGSGLELDEVVGHSLMHMYTNCENLDDACILFNKLPKQNVVTWSTLVSGYADNGHGQAALETFEQMKQHGVQSNQVTFMSVMKACCSLTSLLKGRMHHSDVIECGFELDLCIGNVLIDMYSRCGSIKDASIIFHRMPLKDVITWTTLISGYSHHGLYEEAIVTFNVMQSEGLEPNPITLASLLRLFSSKENLHRGREIHALSIQLGKEFDAYVGTILIDMYFNSCSVNDALTVFNRTPHRGVVAWNTIITFCAHHGNSLDAINIYQQMLTEGLVQPDSVTYLCLLKYCQTTGNFEEGLLIHLNVVEAGFSSDLFVGCAIIDLYIKCGCLEDANRIFDSLPTRNIVTWNTLMGGYSDDEHCRKIFHIFQHMRGDNLTPDSVTLLHTIKACSSIAALQQGWLMHTYSVYLGLDSECSVGNSLIDMYASCGNLKEAIAVFESLPVQDNISWSSLITGYARHGDYLGALSCYEDMQSLSLKPDEVTFVCLLSACSHGGLVAEGCMHFKSMIEKWGIMPKLEHYNAMIGILSHVGSLHKAEDLLETAPFGKNIVGWTQLLHSSRAYLNLDVGQRSFDNMVVLDLSNSVSYILLHDLYTGLCQWEEAKRLEELRKVANAWKKPARSFIEIDDHIHEFVVGDTTHVRSAEIYDKLKLLSTRLRKEWIGSQSGQISEHTEDDERENALCGHSEKLAIAFGLISTASFTTLRVSKNLRMCYDCHDTTKFISKVETRNIVVKDAFCVHRFHMGSCSCKA